MNDFLERFQTYLQSRSPRERWLLVLVGCLAAAIAVRVLVVGPFDARAEAAADELSQSEDDISRAVLLRREVQLIQSELAAVKERIKPGEKTNLLALLERLAAEATITKDQLESLKPKAASGNLEFPETRVEVSLRGVDLDRTVKFLRKIQSSSSYLIIRSLKIQRRPSKRTGDAALDVSFSVSSFERA